MTRECDGIIAVHKVSGVPGIVTDISTPGIHSKLSFHYRERDPQTGRVVTPSATGARGTAVDFGGRGRRLSDLESARVYAAFEPYGRVGQLSELFCGQVDWCVYQGKLRLWIDIPQPTRRTIRNAHYNHIHVAVRPGVFLRPPDQPLPAPHVPEEDDLPRYADQIVWPDGSKTQVTEGGAVKCFGAPFHGSMFDLKPELRKTFTIADAITAHDPNNKDAGYKVWSENGDGWDFPLKPDQRK